MGQSSKDKTQIFAAGVLWVAFLTMVWCWKHDWAYLYAWFALAVYYWISVVITTSANPLRLAMGTDNRLSTSKLQFFVWTAVIVFVYVRLFATLHPSQREILSNFPPNVLLVMGFSVTTAVGAKGITVSYLNSGQITKPASSQPGGDTSLSGLVAKDDSSTPDLTKLQMLIWTAIAVVAYLAQVRDQLPIIAACKLPLSPGDMFCKFPDIDKSLMVLMGISQGAYLGNKLVTAGSPALTALSPSVGIPGADVTISGQSMGSSPDGNAILINGQNMSVATTSWTDSAVHFAVPAKRPDGTSWSPGEHISVSMIVNGQQTSSLTFAFSPQPVIVIVNPPNPPKGAPMTISGRSFGAKQATSKMHLNNIECTQLVTSWTDTQILFAFQNVLPGGAAWQAGQVVAVQVAVSDDFISAPAPNNVTTA